MCGYFLMCSYLIPTKIIVLLRTVPLVGKIVWFPSCTVLLSHKILMYNKR